MDTDAQHLRLLSIGHYIVGGLSVFCGCIPFIHLGVGIAMVTGAFEAGPNPPPPFVGWIFIVGAAIFIAGAWALAICLILTGRKINSRKNYWFCFVMACIECAFSPFGTVLGIFTIIVLLRPSVKILFGLEPDNPTGPGREDYELSP